MRTERFVISDRSWAIIEPLVPGSVRDSGVTARDTRLFLEAVLWRVRVGGPWRDLPPGFGAWNSVFRRFRRWAQGGVFQRIFEAVSEDPDFEYVLIDGTIVSAHQKASGAKGGLSIRPLGARKAD
jgi:transposase